MAYKVLKVADSNYSNTSHPGWAFFNQYETTYTTTGPQEWLIVNPLAYERVGITVIPTGTVGVEVTCSPVDRIEAGSTVQVASLKQPVDYSALTSPTYIPLTRCTAVRLNIASGTAIISVTM